MLRPFRTFSTMSQCFNVPIEQNFEEKYDLCWYVNVIQCRFMLLDNWECEE